MFLTIVVIIAIFVIVAILFSYFEAQREKMLRDRYGNSKYLNYIINRKICIGFTEDMLLDSIGNPVDRDLDMSIKKRKEVWKYDHEGGNRYKTRVIIENRIVTGFKQRN